AKRSVPKELVVPEDGLANRPQPRDRPLGSLVPEVRLDAHPMGLFGLERVSEEQVFRFRIDRSPPEGRVEPGPSDLDRKILSFDVQKSGHPYGTVLGAQNGGEREVRACPL